MMHGIHKFQNVWAWFVVNDGHIVDQGHNEDETVARNEYQTAVQFWAVHDHEVG